MKVIILAGGYGTRISEESDFRPKPLIEIGGRPILWHIMKIYAHHGLRDFIICCGYKGHMIKEYFVNYFLRSSSMTVETATGAIEYHDSFAEDWRVTLVDTGLDSMTGGRLGRVAPYLEGEQTFCFTYGDGVSDVDIRGLVDFHQSHGKKATLTAVVPPGRYGALDLDGASIRRFIEKPPGDKALINGGFFVLDRSVLSLIKDDQTVWEREPLETLAATGELQAFKHTGFWQPMDTLREKRQLEDKWARGAAPGKVWDR